MKFTLFVILTLFFIPVWAQKTHVIEWKPGLKAQQSNLEIEVGDTVKWVFTESVTYNVVASDLNAPRDFGSATLRSRGSSYEYVFTRPGTVKFHSSTNPERMKGSVKVLEKSFSDRDKYGFKIFPNPVKDRIYFQDDTNSPDLDITFYDVLGKVVKKEKITPFTARGGMDVSQLKRGVYLVQIDNGSNTFTQKLIKN